MVLKPQLQELLAKQFSRNAWEAPGRKRDLMLAVAAVGAESLFLTDGILVLESRGADLARKLAREPGFDLELADLEGFVCLFEDCRISLSDGRGFAEPDEGALVKMFRGRDFRSEIRRGEADLGGLAKLRNLEREEPAPEGRFSPGAPVIDLAARAGPAKLRKKIAKKRKRGAKEGRKRRQSASTEESTGLRRAASEEPPKPAVNFYLGFARFSVISPNGKHFLSGKREMMARSLSLEQMQVFERKFKLERHIARMRNPAHREQVSVLELGDLLGEVCCEAEPRAEAPGPRREEAATLTSTPSAASKDRAKGSRKRPKFKSKKRRNKRKSHLKS